MDYYPQRAIRSGEHDPVFGREFTELVLATLACGLGAHFVAMVWTSELASQREVGALSMPWQFWAIYIPTLSIWGLISSHIRKRIGWGLSLVACGVVLPLVPLFVGGMLSAPGLPTLAPS